MTHWDRFTAESRLADKTYMLSLPFWRVREINGKRSDHGLFLTPFKNTWLRKRETAYLIETRYYIKGEILMRHVEPWVSFPSDLLITKLMLLPVEVTEEN